MFIVFLSGMSRTGNNVVISCNSVYSEFGNNLMSQSFYILDIHQADRLISFLSFFFLNRVSELRVVELLDGLCEKMQDYTLEKVTVFLWFHSFVYYEIDTGICFCN